MSTALPAVSGTTARTVFVGHGCAAAGKDTMSATRASANHKRLISTSLSRPGRGVALLRARRSPDGAARYPGQALSRTAAPSGRGDQNWPLGAGYAACE